MSKAPKKTLKEVMLDTIIHTPEYMERLREIAADIKKASNGSSNESSTVSCFELELFSFINKELGLKYYPKKEVFVNTVRHVARGRIDSRIGSLIIEFKHYSKLKKETDRLTASDQLSGYLQGLHVQSKQDFLGVVTDGIVCQFIRMENGVLFEESFMELSNKHLARIIFAIISLDKIALTPRNLVKDFCEPLEESPALELVHILCDLLINSSTPRTEMLFTEWKELFRLAHDDKSKQKAIEERTEALSLVIGRKLSSHDNDEQYKVLFSLQTAYAIIIKLIAYKVISKIRLDNSQIDFNGLAKSNHKAIRLQMNSLEEGAIFRSMGIGNLLEGDFFSWYSTDQQWNSALGDSVKKVLQILAKYEDIAVFKEGNRVQDLFKDLFLTIMPDKVRHSLGEFYTPTWLADNLVSDSINMLGKGHASWSGLDPCAGSGTFVTVMIGKVLQETGHLTKQKKLNAVLERVKAIDLNPLAVLTTRINYFINISHLIDDDVSFEIPVYLGDASYVPEEVFVEKVVCLKYRIRTLKGELDVLIPKSAIRNNELFSKVMTEIETDIKNQDTKSIYGKLLKITEPKDRTTLVKENIQSLAESLVEFEKNDWNGIWARIITNFLTTANLGKFDLIVGNPPWIDWKNLPAGYRDRIKSLCVSRELFSGDGVTGGINLNVCALISNVSAQNWLKASGILAFLMPQSLIFQQSYEGFRNFRLDKNKHMYFQKVYDWTKSGHPFSPVQEKFLTYFLKKDFKEYSEGIEARFFKIKSGESLRNCHHIENFAEISGIFDQNTKLIGQCSSSNSTFTYAEDKTELDKFKLIAGVSKYIGREGIEFYPQEIYLLQVDDSIKHPKDKIYLKNYQNSKSKYKIPQQTKLIEKKFLHPLIKGTNIERFNIAKPEYIVPFPYELNQKIPLDCIALSKASPLLAKLFMDYKSVIESQTMYNDKIIGNDNAEFYALARVGIYSFAKHYVAFRDNSKWHAAVVTEMETEWGGVRRPQFQNHAVSICERDDGRFISLDEAHYVCAVLNAPLVNKYLLNSSDSRSFKIRPPVNVPLYNKDPIQIKLSKLSKKAHLNYDNEKIMEKIDLEIDELYLALLQKIKN